MKKVYVLSTIDWDTGRTLGVAVFDSMKELKKGLKRWEDDINSDKLPDDEPYLLNEDDYTIDEVIINNFY